MKKVLFIAVAALAFAACGNSTTEEQVEATPVTETVVETVVTTDSTAVAADSTVAATPAVEVK